MNTTEDDALYTRYTRVRFMHEVVCCYCHRNHTLYGVQLGERSHMVAPVCEVCARDFTQAKLAARTGIQAQRDAQWKLACQGIVDEYQRWREMQS